MGNSKLGLFLGVLVLAGAGAFLMTREGTGGAAVQEAAQTAGLTLAEQAAAAGPITVYKTPT